MSFIPEIEGHLKKIWSYRRTALYLAIIISSIFSTYKIIQFFNAYELSFRSPVAFRNPVVLTVRKNALMNVVGQADRDINPLTEDQKYLCNKFGKDCRIALAIFRAESSLRPHAIGVNKDGSVDFGCMQINSVHLKNIDASQVNLLNCRDNIDVAYKIFKQRNSFAAWSAYKSGIYKKYLIN